MPKADQLVTYRPSTREWWVYDHVRRVWGEEGDIPVPADYGSGAACPAVFRPRNGTWYIEAHGVTKEWGYGGDIPVPADYNGDGKCEVAVFRPGQCTWWVLDGRTDVRWGEAGDVPIPADYLGTGRAQFAVYRPHNRTWWIEGAPPAWQGVQWGLPGDIPVPADYNGDGRAEIAVFRPSDATWWILNGRTNVALGRSGDIPVPGDYDGDGRVELAVYSNEDSSWRIEGLQNRIRWGEFGDYPIPCRFDHSTPQLLGNASRNFVHSFSAGAERGADSAARRAFSDSLYKPTVSFAWKVGGRIFGQILGHLANPPEAGRRSDAPGHDSPMPTGDPIIKDYGAPPPRPGNGPEIA